MGPMALLGTPEQPFLERLNRTTGGVCGLMDYISLATAFALLYRIRPMPRAARLFLGIAILSFLANIVWRRRFRSSHLRWREVPAALFRLSGFGFGAGCVLIKGFLDQVPPANTSRGELAAASWHALLLLLGSIVPSLLLLWLARPVRISFAVPVQLALTLNCAKHNIDTCSAAAFGLGTQLGDRLMHAAFGLLRTLRYSMYPPGTHLALPPDEQCSVMLTYLQLTLGFTLPALIQAAVESRLYMQHQRQRRRAGLQPEHGWQALLYAGLADTIQVLDGPLMLLLLWIVMGIMWDMALLLSANAPGTTAVPAGSPAAAAH